MKNYFSIKFFILLAFVIAISSCSQEGKVESYYNKPFEKKATLTDHKKSVRSLAFHPNGKILLSGGVDKYIKIWDADQGYLVKSFKAHNGGIYGLKFNKKGTQFISGAWDDSVKLWDFNQVRVIWEFKGHKSYIWSIDFSPDESKIMSTSWDKTVKIWNTYTGELITTLTGHIKAVISGKYAPNGNVIATGDWTGQLIIWDATTWKQLHSIKAHPEKLLSMIFNKNGNRLITAGYNEVKVWDTVTWKQIRLISTKKTLPTFVTLIDEDQTLVIAKSNEEIDLVDLETGAITQTFKAHKQTIFQLAINSKNNIMASASKDDTVILWHR